jgi:phosphate transport system permease protein
LVGDQEFNSPKTLSAFALALVLFVATFILNLLALKISKNFEKKHG